MSAALEFSADEELRAELREWLAENPPPAIDVVATREDADALRAWQRTLQARRWVGIHWPSEYGGRGAAVTQGAIYNQEVARGRPPGLRRRGGLTPGRAAM